MGEIWRKEWLGDLYGEQGTGEVMCMVHEGIRENGYEKYGCDFSMRMMGKGHRRMN